MPHYATFFEGSHNHATPIGAERILKHPLYVVHLGESIRNRALITTAEPPVRHGRGILPSEIGVKFNQTIILPGKRWGLGAESSNLPGKNRLMRQSPPILPGKNAVSLGKVPFLPGRMAHHSTRWPSDVVLRVLLSHQGPFIPIQKGGLAQYMQENTIKKSCCVENDHAILKN